jgi:Sigma-54 interaction domain
LKKLRHTVTGEFVDVNCATLRGDAAMSALFGHVQGAFTGALRDRPASPNSLDGVVHVSLTVFLLFSTLVFDLREFPFSMKPWLLKKPAANPAAGEAGILLNFEHLPGRESAPAPMLF